MMSRRKAFAIAKSALLTCDHGAFFIMMCKKIVFAYRQRRRSRSAIIEMNSLLVGLPRRLEIVLPKYC